MSNAPIFLHGKAIRHKISEIIQRDTGIKLAVAYWGKNTDRFLPIFPKDWNKDVKIVCDLQSGFCDLGVIREMLAKDGFEVRQENRLHAKVYLTSDAVVLGSANASRQGLEDPGDLSLETAVLLDGANYVEPINIWFDELWKRAVPIKAPQLKSAARIIAAMRRFEKTRKAESEPFFNILTKGARDRVMNWAKKEVDVVTVRFGNTGLDGKSPNFQILRANGKRENYQHPRTDGGATIHNEDWSDEHLTSPIPVDR